NLQLICNLKYCLSLPAGLCLMTLKFLQNVKMLKRLQRNLGLKELKFWPLFAMSPTINRERI
ncbi:hypothetical protein HN51_052792, partial [Arachis hypogaea]